MKIIDRERKPTNWRFETRDGRVITGHYAKKERPMRVTKETTRLYEKSKRINEHTCREHKIDAVIDHKLANGKELNYKEWVRDTERTRAKERLAELEQKKYKIDLSVKLQDILLDCEERVIDLLYNHFEKGTEPCQNKKSLLELLETVKQYGTYTEWWIDLIAHYLIRDFELNGGLTGVTTKE